MRVTVRLSVAMAAAALLALAMTQPTAAQTTTHPDKQNTACSEYGDYLKKDETTTCTCSQPSEQTDTGRLSGLPPVTLLVDTETNEQSHLVGDVLTIKFSEPVKFYYSSATWAAPDVNFPNVGVANKGARCEPAFWTWSHELTDQCTRVWTGTIAWTDAYRTVDDDGCGFTKTISQDGDYMEFHLDFSVTTREDLPELDTDDGSQRGDGNHPRNRVIVHKLPLTVRFPLQVTATSGDIVLFSPVRVIAAIVNQEVHGDPIDGVTNLVMQATIFTSVQWPFKLVNVAYDTGNDEQGNPIKENTKIDYHSDGTYTGPVQSGADCLTGDGIDTPVVCDVNAWKDGIEDKTNCPVCENNWEVYFSPNDEQQCNFNGRYGLTWDVACHTTEPAASTCPLSSTAADNVLRISFNIQSSNHCPQVIDTVEFTTANLETYEDAPGGQPKDDFLDQQRIYFQGEFATNDVSITNTQIVQIELLRPNKASEDDVVLYTCNADRSVCEPTAEGTEFDIQNMATGNIAEPAPGTVSLPSFDLLVDTRLGGVFNLAADEREIVQFKVIVDVTYFNAGQSYDPAQPTVLQRRLMSVTTSGKSSNKDQQVSAKQSLGVGSAAVSSSNSLFGYSLGQIAAASVGAGFLGAIVVGSVVIRNSRRRARMLKAESQLNMMGQPATELTTV
eukprot:TRINITY_DN65838_c3_g3_i1.p1 TRINITY_DN65838_c3_g3~~TRINITY_DN65838_c3_g3_i1.p1  ORF type:complete len:671 (+),score=398.00 TRINITY_DN65838_c3_g3_i1:128-2140(+)